MEDTEHYSREFIEDTSYYVDLEEAWSTISEGSDFTEIDYAAGNIYDTILRLRWFILQWNAQVNEWYDRSLLLRGVVVLLLLVYPVVAVVVLGPRWGLFTVAVSTMVSVFRRLLRALLGRDSPRGW